MNTLNPLQQWKDKERGNEVGNNLYHNQRLTSLVSQYKNALLKQHLEELTKLPKSDLRARVEALISNFLRNEQKTLNRRDRDMLVTTITNEVAGFGPLQPLLDEPNITEVMVNEASRIYVEQAGRLQHQADIIFEDDDHIRHVIDRIISPLGRRVDESSPMVDARLPDGSRVNAIIPPLSLNGPVITIRRFRQTPITTEDLVGFGALTPDMLTFLKACVVGKLNILVSGGTGSGKTTLLNVLSSFIPAYERIITIEDAAELQFWRMHPHVLRQEARPANVEGKGAISIRQLVANALRMRPDRIVVGEVRGAESLDMLQAMNTGHDGSLTTVHANSTRDALNRLETLVMFADTELPSAAIRRQIAGALDIIIQQSRLPDGSRKITCISEVLGLKRGEILLRDIYKFDSLGLDEQGRVIGNHSPTGIVPKAMPKFKAHGVNISPDHFKSDYLQVVFGDDLWADQSISEIMFNGPAEVYVEQGGQLQERPDIAANVRDEHHLLNIINYILAPIGRLINEDSPMVDARLADGSRVNAVLKPVGMKGPYLTIRRFPASPLTVDKLVAYGSLDGRMVQFLQACVRTQLNILISGGTGSGKTTLLNVLSRFIPDGERIVTVEDAAELQLQQAHVLPMEARPADEFGENAVPIRELVRNALRMRPDRIIAGEVRGEEALDMLQAMNTGHEGSMTTVHANSSRDAMARLETLVMMAKMALPSAAIRDQLASALHIVIQQNRLRDGSRRITAISEVVGIDQDGSVLLHDIFKFKANGLDNAGKIQGQFIATGYIPACLTQMEAFGEGISADLFQA